MAKQTEIRVTVSGVLPFPVDMLRYDGLHPHREEDSHRIIASISHEVRGRTTVELERWAERTWKPTVGRWESFSWRVEKVEETGRVRT